MQYLDHREFHHDQMHQENLVGDLPEPHHRPAAQQPGIGAGIAQCQRRHHQCRNRGVEADLHQSLRQTGRRCRRLTGDRRGRDEVTQHRQRHGEEPVAPNTHRGQHRQHHSADEPRQVPGQPQAGAVRQETDRVHQHHPRRTDQCQSCQAPQQQTWSPTAAAQHHQQQVGEDG